MTRERIDSLESDKTYFRELSVKLQIELDQLRPDNARLREQLASGRILDLVSLVLIALGGGVISYATFVKAISEKVADAGFGALLSGILLLICMNILRIKSKIV